MANKNPRVKINQSILELVQGDITRQDVDAIVNAANTSLLGGGGVDGAIHRTAGPGLLAETRTLGGCETGEAKITGGYNLTARHVIHAVGPVYRRGDELVAALLASAYRRCLEIADENNLVSMAFPAISCGVYGYPLDEASSIALGIVVEYLSGPTGIKLVRFVLYTRDVFEVFARTLDELVRVSDQFHYVEDDS